MSKPKRFTLWHGGLSREFLFANNSASFVPLNALVISLHGYTEDADTAMGRVLQLHQLGFAAVAPLGLHSSWNARYCCGDAMKLGIDDAGFIVELVQFIIRDWMHNTTRIYLTGYSNGASLASIIGLRAIADGQQWLSGLALMAGYTYDSDLYRRAIDGKGKRFFVFSAHGLADKFVNPAGCCDSQPACCCEISSHATCISIRDAFNSWRSINRCVGSNVSLVRDTSFPFRSDHICHRAEFCEYPIFACDLPGVSHTFSVEEVLAKLFYEDFLSTVSVSQVNSENLPGPSPQDSLQVILVVIILFVIVVSWSVYFVWARATDPLLSRRASNLYELVSQSESNRYRDEETTVVQVSSSDSGSSTHEFT